jgi:hypothetical protein
MAWVKTNPADDELLINFPAQARANWAAIELGTDAALKVTNAKIAAAAGIVDTKLATISTAGKVNGAALTGLASVPAGAGNIPEANLGNAVKGPGSNTDGYIPLWDGADSKTLKAGVELDTDGGLTANSDTKVASQKAVKTYADTKLAIANKASQAQAEAGVEDTKYMTALRTKQSIDANVPEASVDDTTIEYSGGNLQVKDSGISQTKLKTATGEVSDSYSHFYRSGGFITLGGVPTVEGKVASTVINVASYTTHLAIGLWTDGTDAYQSSSLKTLPGGSYGFFPQSKQTDSGYDSYVYAQQRYVTASGHDHWIFLLVDKETGKPISSYQAPDHPSANQGDATELDIPHPFGSYDPEKHEIVVVDNSDLQTMIQKKKQRRANGERGVSLLQVINENYLIDDTKRPNYQPREIVKIDEEGDLEGEVIKTMKTPDWAKIMISNDEISLKRRMVEKLPNDILFKKMALKK